MFDLLLIASLGFLGSFGHCVGMCGPIAVAFALAPGQSAPSSWQHQVTFHGLLNAGRILSYTLVGAAIGALGSVLVAGGQLAGIDSLLRQGLTTMTGCLLIWMGLVQIAPGYLPRIPFLHPILQGQMHHQLTSGMAKLSLKTRWWTPALLGMVWGLIPCGFLYTAQLKAAETGNLRQGMLTMLAFGLGTLPAMGGIGLFSSRLSTDRRSQLFRVGGWLTLTMGVLLLLRTSEMVDLTGHAALICLALALIARPISRLWPGLLQYRRVLGVGAFVLAIAHTLHMVDHTFNWNLQALGFMLPSHQIALGLGAASLVCLTPLALTSTDWMVKQLGSNWRRLHLLAIPAFLLAALHGIMIGSHYLGNLERNSAQIFRVGMLGLGLLLVLLLRSRWFWELISHSHLYVPPSRVKS
jgi:sulfite exporter TauE/SafE